MHSSVVYAWLFTKVGHTIKYAWLPTLLHGACKYTTGALEYLQGRDMIFFWGGGGGGGEIGVDITDYVVHTGWQITSIRLC